MQAIMVFERGRQGDVIGWHGGRIVLPERGFRPQERSVWLVELSDRGKFFLARPIRQPAHVDVGNPALNPLLAPNLPRRIYDDIIPINRQQERMASRYGQHVAAMIVWDESIEQRLKKKAIEAAQKVHGIAPADALQLAETIVRERGKDYYEDPRYYAHGDEFMGLVALVHAAKAYFEQRTKS